MAKLHCAFTIILLCVTQSVKLTSGQAGTLGFYLNGVAYPDGSTVLRADIGEDDAALQCTTDSTTCCRNTGGETRGGDFFLPVANGGGWVPNYIAATDGYYRRRDSRIICLNREPSGVITGQFRCNIPSASGVDVDLYINIIDMAVSITPSGVNSAGASYSLECFVNVTGSSDPPTNITWFDPMNSTVPSEMVSTTGSMSTLTFDPLSASHAGTYTCRATLGGAIGAAMEEITVEVAALSVLVTPPPTTIFTGSSPTLVCTVEFNVTIDDAQLAVNVSWVLPGGSVSSGEPVTTLNSSTYTSRITLDAVTYTDAGTYTCQVVVSSQLLFITGTQSAEGSTNITIAPLPPPTNLMVIETSATSISLSWTQSEGAAAVDRYEISYSFTINGCPELGTTSRGSIDVGSVTTYMLVDSGSNPIEEDGVYDISVRAVNSVAMSEDSRTTTTTPRAAPNGPPQNIRNTSTNSTSITIQWDEVDCRQRNGWITFYQVMFSWVLQNVIFGRTFTASELLPRSSYSFSVTAVNSTFATGPPGTVTVDTSIPEEVGFLLGGSLYGNNSVVTISDIGEGSEALHCLTNRVDCCRGADTGGDGVGEWYFPGDGSAVGTSNGGGSIYRNRGPSVVRLNRRNNAMMPTGVFRCEIPDASGTNQNVYVGVYSWGIGAPQISSLNFSLELQELICTTSVSPPTTVSWRRNGQPLTIDGTTYEQSQRVIDTSDSVYDNILYSSNVTNFVGTFECMVANSIGEASRSVVVDNVAISTSQFTINSPAVAICTTILDGVANIAWLRDDIVVMEGGALTRLDLVFSAVNDSLHGDVYTCRVTLTTGVTHQSNITISVEFLGNPISISADALEEGTAGQPYTLNCTVYKIGGLINSPVAFWTVREMPVSNGSGISIATVYRSLSTTSVLTFDPLRTSHGNVYVCEGSLTSPAHDSPFTVSSQPDLLNVKISAPFISITVPRGLLYAGTAAPTSLTCTISLDPAVDDPVSIDQITVQWMRGMTELSNTTSRVTISTLSGSLPTFTSVLALEPLSTEDTSFTCLARAQPSGQNLFVSASDQGEGMTIIPVLPPPDPVVMISSSGSSTAGQTLTLTCSVVLLAGLVPSASVSFMWSTGDNGPNLTLPSLLISQGGVYTCTARLTIPEAGVDVTGSNSINVVVQIPQPSLMISAAPRDEGFFTGLGNFSLTCSANIGPHVDSDVTVRTAWLFNGSPLLSSDDISVGDASSVVEQVSNSTVRFTSLGLNDAGNYTCQVGVYAVNSNFLLGVNGSTTRRIVIETFPVQVVQLTREGTSTAGHSLMFICQTSRDRLLSATLKLEWIGPGGSLVEEGSGVSIEGQSSTEDKSLSSTLVFNHLSTSQAGPYRCRVNLTIPQENVTDHSVTKTSDLIVRLPAPVSPLVFQFSRDGDLYEGTSFGFTCVITPNRTGVDTPFNIVSTVSGPMIPDSTRISISDAMMMGSSYEASVVFGVLRRDDSGRYTCSATATSDLPYVSASELSTVTEMITVVALPPPIVTISATPSPTAGRSHQLNCVALVPEFTVLLPLLEWTPIGNSAAITTPPQLNGTISASRFLNFEPLHTSHGGVYTCQATLNIPQAGIADRSSTFSESVVVQIPTSTVSITRGPYPHYNGTVFSLTCELDLDLTVVDTDVMVVWAWSLNRREVETQRSMSPSARQIVLTFEPLATDSSGLYYLNLTVLPAENSDYIIQNNDSSTSYALVVEALPVPVVTTAITSRSGDICSEARAFTCTATTVDNVFATPTITWLFGGNPVPSSGSDPVADSSTGQLVFNDISSSNAGEHTCRASLTIPEAGIVDLFNQTSRTISTDQPDRVQSFKCLGVSVSTLSLSWERPVQVGSGITGYTVEVRRLQHTSPGSQDLESVPLVPEYNIEVKEVQAEVNQGLEPEVPYNVTVKPLNSAGCGPKQQLYCFTREGVPPRPQNVVVSRLDSTTIAVSWTKLTLVELKGLASYVITYNVVIPTRKKQEFRGMTNVSWMESSVFLSNLQPGAQYDVTVSIVTSAGTSVATLRSDDSDTVDSVSGSDNTAAIIGGVVAVVLVIAVTVITISCISLILRNRRAEFELRQLRSAHDPPGAVVLSTIPHTNIALEVGGDSGDHEYELLDKYSQPYEVCEATPTKQEQKKPSSSSGYELTQCPAYVPVTHGNQPAETSMKGPPAANSPIKDSAASDLYENVSPNL